jgi:general nucleoside transport system ATP-binding protein
VRGIDLVVRAGEIVGVAGVEGNGQRELVECCVGLRPPSAGSVRVAGAEVSGGTVEEHREHGVSFIPEDRRARGLVLDMALWENIALGRHDRPPLATGVGLLAIGRIKALCARLLRRYDVRARSVSVAASTLSGGNQQKLVLARELDAEPRLLIAHQPTRGLDVGAIEFVWRRMVEQREAGRGVLLVSAELEEIYALADRIVTIYDGRITGEFAPSAPPEEIGVGMTGGAASGDRNGRVRSGGGDGG